MKQLTDRLRAVAKADGQDVSDAFVYGNYALADTPLEMIWKQNVPRLSALRKAVDPQNVMGQTGGFRF
jgi:hypothetical protein